MPAALRRFGRNCAAPPLRRRQFESQYTGPALSLTHRSDRTARWGKGKVSVMALFSAQADYLSSPTDDGKELDADFTDAGGRQYNSRTSKH